MSTQMTEGLCGEDNQNDLRMVNNRCNNKFPSNLYEETEVNVWGYLQNQGCKNSHHVHK